MKGELWHEHFRVKNLEVLPFSYFRLPKSFGGCNRMGLNFFFFLVLIFLGMLGLSPDWVLAEHLKVGCG